MKKITTNFQMLISKPIISGSIYIFDDPLEYPVLFGWLQLSAWCASHRHITEFDNAVAIFGFLLQHLHETEKAESQNQLNATQPKRNELNTQLHIPKSRNK